MSKINRTSGSSSSFLVTLGGFALPLIASVSLAGCLEVEPLDPADELRGDINCPRWQCGYNTSELNGKSLQELDLGGQANDDGVRLVEFITPLGLLGYELEADGDELVARGGLLGGTTLRGPALIGSILVFDLGDGVELPVTITDYEDVPSWATGSPAVAAYGLSYADLGEPLLEQSICKGTLVDPLQAAVVILAGERYDQASKTVIPNQGDWITLGCAGSATAKMALLGYGPNGDLGGQGAPASVAQRQATLKMITADYCGDGTSYTVDGTPLAWENVDGSVMPSSTPGASEAIWTDQGALCLDTPRVVERGEVACALPTCANFDIDDGEWMTHLAGE